MLNDQNRESLNIGFKINRNKTKQMFNCNILKKIIKINELEVQEYIYFRHLTKLKKDHANEKT